MNKSFKQHADEQLSHITMSEALKHQVRSRVQGTITAPPRRPRMVQIALIILLLLGTVTAFALSRGFGLFDLMGTVTPRFSHVRPEAEDLLRKDLARYSFEHVDVAVREAAYDGRYLRVAYSVTDRAAVAPLDEPGKSLTDGREDIFSFSAAAQDNIQWNTLDWAEVDGENVNPKGMSFSVAGPDNGEAITWVQFDMENVDLPDSFTVRLPVRGRDTPKELEFTMDKSGMSHVFCLKPPPDKRMNNYAVHVQEVMVSPIRVYITLHLIADPGLTPEEVWKIANHWNGLETALSDVDGGSPLRLTDTGAGPIDNMNWVRVDLPDGEFDYKDVIVDPGKPVTVLITLEFSPPDEYPAAFRLGHSETDFIIIPFEKLTSPDSP